MVWFGKDRAQVETKTYHLGNTILSSSGIFHSQVEENGITTSQFHCNLGQKPYIKVYFVMTK